MIKELIALARSIRYDFVSGIHFVRDNFRREFAAFRREHGWS